MQRNESLKKEFTKYAVEKGTELFNNNKIISFVKDNEENYDAFNIVVRDEKKDYNVFVGYTPEGEILLCECTKERIDNKEHSDKSTNNCEHEYASLLEIDKYYQ